LSAVCSKLVNSAALADFGCGYCLLFTFAAMGLASLRVWIRWRFRLSAVCSKLVNSAALADFGCGYCLLFTFAATGLASQQHIAKRFLAPAQVGGYKLSLLAGDKFRRIRISSKSKGHAVGHALENSSLTYIDRDESVLGTFF